MRRKTAIAALFLLVIYLCLAGFLYFAQRSMVFVPDTGHTTPAENGVGDMQVIHVRTPDGLTLEGWYKPPVTARLPTIVFFQGNGGSMRNRGFEGRQFMDAGYGFLFAEYRGYGGNPGMPTEQNFYIDGHAFTDWLLQRNGGRQDRVVFEGESLGTGVAVKMARDYPGTVSLVLLSPYTSLPDVVARTYFYVPVHWLMRDPFNSLALIGHITMPLLVVHGEHDRIVPFAMGKALYDAAPQPKQLAAIPQAGHLNLHEYGAQTRVLSFLEQYAKP